MCKLKLLDLNYTRDLAVQTAKKKPHAIMMAGFQRNVSAHKFVSEKLFCLSCTYRIA